MNKQAAARDLFNLEWEQKDIAKVLKTTEKTISEWKKKGDWDKKRTEAAIHLATSEEALWELISYQLAVLKRKKDEWLKDEPDSTKLIDKGDIDALQKMFSVVKKEQQTWTTYVTVLREFMDKLQSVDSNLAKKLVEPVDNFLNDMKNKF
ncbi:MAG: hypothetical protein AB7G44_03410 [Bacteroidia bacterium]